MIDVKKDFQETIRGIKKSMGGGDYPITRMTGQQQTEKVATVNCGSSRGAKKMATAILANSQFQAFLDRHGATAAIEVRRSRLGVPGKQIRIVFPNTGSSIAPVQKKEALQLPETPGRHEPRRLVFDCDGQHGYMTAVQIALLDSERTVWVNTNGKNLTITEHCMFHEGGGSATQNPADEYEPPLFEIIDLHAQNPSAVEASIGIEWLKIIDHALYLYCNHMLAVFGECEIPFIWSPSDMSQPHSWAEDDPNCPAIAIYSVLWRCRAEHREVIVYPD